MGEVSQGIELSDIPGKCAGIKPGVKPPLLFRLDATKERAVWQTSRLLNAMFSATAFVPILLVQGKCWKHSHSLNRVLLSLEKVHQCLIYTLNSLVHQEICNVLYKTINNTLIYRPLKQSDSEMQTVALWGIFYQHIIQGHFFNLLFYYKIFKHLCLMLLCFTSSLPNQVR